MQVKGLSGLAHAHEWSFLQYIQVCNRCLRVVILNSIIRVTVHRCSRTKTRTQYGNAAFFAHSFTQIIVGTSLPTAAAGRADSAAGFLWNQWRQNSYFANSSQNSTLLFTKWIMFMCHSSQKDSVHKPRISTCFFLVHSQHHEVEIRIWLLISAAVSVQSHFIFLLFLVELLFAVLKQDDSALFNFYPQGLKIRVVHKVRWYFNNFDERTSGYGCFECWFMSIEYVDSLKWRQIVSCLHCNHYKFVFLS